MFKELTNGVCAVDFESVSCATELLQQPHVVERSAEEQELHVIAPAGLLAEFIRPEEDAMRVIKKQRRAELVKKARCLARELRVRNARLNFLVLGRRRWNWQNDLGTTKGRHSLSDLCKCRLFKLAGHSDCANCSRRAFKKSTSVHLRVSGAVFSLENTFRHHQVIQQRRTRDSLGRPSAPVSVARPT